MPSKKNISSNEISQLKKELESVLKQLDTLGPQKLMYEERHSAQGSIWPAHEEKDYRKVISDIKKLNTNKTKLERKLHKLNSTDKSIERKAKAEAGRNKSTSLTPRKDVLDEFANRVRELEYLKSAGYTFPFQQIYAPAGYGKTRLLRRIKQVYEDEGEKWSTAWLSFRETEPTPETELDVVNVLLHDVGIKHPTGKLESRINQLCKVLSKNPRVLLLIDGVECANDYILGWIEDDLIENIRQRNIRIHDLRVLFSSRYYRERVRHKIGPTFRPFPLSHFSFDDLLLVIYKRSDKISLQDRKKIAWNLMLLTKGHPKCVGLILDALKDEDYNPRFDERGYFVRFSEIFETIVKKVVYDEIVSDAVQRNGVDLDALKILTILRKINANFLFLLRDIPPLHYYSLADLEKRVMFLTNQLPKTGLFSYNRSDQTFSVDPIVRYIFNLEKLSENCSSYKDLHSLIFNTYENWCFQLKILGQIKPEGAKQISFLVEALYHFCQFLKFERLSVFEASERLYSLLETWRPHLKPEGDNLLDLHKRDFQDTIKNDLDLPLLLEELLGKEGYAHFLDMCIA